MDPIGGARHQPLTTQRQDRAEGDALPVIKDRLERGERESLGLIPPDALPRPSARESSAAQALSDAGENKAFPRHMTNVEKARFMRYFPALDVDKAMVTAPATDEYNCISWTVGETHQWFWPPEMFPEGTEDEAFDKFYASYGLQPSEKGEVARWGNAAGLTHGCVSGPDHGPRWESKCGSDLRIEHALAELEGDAYGKADKYYTKKGEVHTMAAYEPIEIPGEVLSGVRERAAEVAPAVREQFDAYYADWQRFRSEPRVRFSASPAEHCRTAAFAMITEMGVGAIPLLMEKMADGDFFCLQAVEAIRKHAPPHAGMAIPGLSAAERNNSEQNKAALMLMRWHAD